MLLWHNCGFRTLSLLVTILTNPQFIGGELVQQTQGESQSQREIVNIIKLALCIIEQTQREGNTFKYTVSFGFEEIIGVED